jgi:hypothetical protein
MKALADKAEKWRRQALAAATLADDQLCRGENNLSPLATAAIVSAEQVGREVAKRTSRLASLALVVEQQRREAAEGALELATAALAAALHPQDRTHVGVGYFDVCRRAKMSAGGQSCSNVGQYCVTQCAAMPSFG